MARRGLGPVGNACAALVGVLLCTAPAWAASPQALAAGKAIYAKYCAACHGRNAQGDGPMAAALKTKPADLTRLAKQSGGTFPYMTVLDIVDGTAPIPAHGSSDMPVWGETFQATGAEGGSVMEQSRVRGELMLLVDYLRSVQAP